MKTAHYVAFHGMQTVKGKHDRNVLQILFTIKKNILIRMYVFGQNIFFIDIYWII